LVKEMSPIVNFLVIVTTIGTIGAYFASRLEKLEERVAGLLREVDAKVAGVTTAVDAKVAGVSTAVDAKVAGVVKEVDAKVAGAKEAADKTVRVGRTGGGPPPPPPPPPPNRPRAHARTHAPSAPALSPTLAVRAPQVKRRGGGGFGLVVRPRPALCAGFSCFEPPARAGFPSFETDFCGIFVAVRRRKKIRLRRNSIVLYKCYKDAKV
jgi:hypothetical protein